MTKCECGSFAITGMHPEQNSGKDSERKIAGNIFSRLFSINSGLMLFKKDTLIKVHFKKYNSSGDFLQW